MREIRKQTETEKLKFEIINDIGKALSAHTIYLPLLSLVSSLCMYAFLLSGLSALKDMYVLRKMLRTATECTICCAKSPKMTKKSDPNVLMHVKNE